MEFKIDSGYGNVSVNSSVIAVMAGYIATRCYGVVGMTAKSRKDGIAGLLKPDYMTKGIAVSLENGGINVSMCVMLEYGVNMNVVSGSIVNKVKYELEKMTGLRVNRIDVKVDAVRVD